MTWKNGSAEYQAGYLDAVEDVEKIIQREMHFELIMEEQRRPRLARLIFKSILTHLRRLLT